MGKDIQVITDFRKIDPAKWNEFVLHHPKGTVFHSFELFSVYKNQKNIDLIFICITCQDQISALLIAQLQQEGKGLSGYFSCRSVILGGPLISDDDPELLEILLRTYNKTIPKKVIYTQVRNQYTCSACRDIYLKYGFNFEDHLNIIINLSASEEELWNNIESRKRTNIRRARNNNLKFSVETALEKYHSCYNILSDIYSRIGLPLFPFDYFNDLRQMLNNGRYKSYLCAINDNQEIAGCIFMLSYKDTLYDFYGGSLAKYYKKFPNDLLLWEIFLWGKKNGYKTFDFGGAGKPGVPYGVRDYKLKFGGEVINPGRYIKVHSILRYNLGKLCLKIYPMVKK